MDGVRGEVSHGGVKEGGDVGAKSVLVLEDDIFFNDIIRDFLCENGYSVTVVHGGLEGVFEVQARDFDVIVCDMMMPGMPGDEFYRAVEEARPHLCERFVFMTGLGGNEEANEFIKSVNGCGILKPLPLDDLLETIRFVENRGRFAVSPGTRAARAEPRSAPDPIAAVPVPQNVWPLRGTVPTIAPEETVAVSPRYRRLRTGLTAFVGLSVVVALAAFATRWYGTLRDQVAVSSGELLVLERQWEDATKQQRDVETARAGIEALLKRPDRLAEDRAAPRWAAALRDVATAASPEVAILDVQAKGRPGDPGACELRIIGISTGTAPRVNADGFLHALSANIERHSIKGSATVRFESLEDEPHSPATAPNQRKSKFTIVVAIGAKEALPAKASAMR